MEILKISSGGQISVPSKVRKRWGSQRVSAEDRGDELVIRPVPEDPVAYLRGIFADHEGPTSAELKARSREEEAMAEERKFGRA